MTAPADVLCAGIIVADHVSSPVPRLPAPGELVLADQLRACDVDVSALSVRPGMDTSQTLIVNVAGQDRRFIHTFGANSAFTAGDIPPHRAARCKVLHLRG